MYEVGQAFICVRLGQIAVKYLYPMPVPMLKGANADPGTSAVGVRIHHPEVTDRRGRRPRFPNPLQHIPDRGIGEFVADLGCGKALFIRGIPVAYLKDGMVVLNIGCSWIHGFDLH